MEKDNLFDNDWKKIVEEECLLKGYSQKTIRAYLFHTEKFILSGKTPRDYILCLVKKGLSDESIRSAGFAVKFYLAAIGKDTEGISPVMSNLPNVKRENKLPVILSRAEIEKMITVMPNINHRLIIETGYSAGLRVSEIINLRWADIDFSRDLIHIKKAKGKKDRIVMLSQRLKENLNNLTDSREGYVFLTNRKSRYTQRTIQKIVESAAGKAGIMKKISPHSLRHAFATHLLENGTDIRYIRDLLGHSDIKTTLVYTKVSNRNLCNIKSPFDA